MGELTRRFCAALSFVALGACNNPSDPTATQAPVADHRRSSGVVVSGVSAEEADKRAARRLKVKGEEHTPYVVTDPEQRIPSARTARTKNPKGSERSDIQTASLTP